MKGDAASPGAVQWETQCGEQWDPRDGPGKCIMRDMGIMVRVDIRETEVVLQEGPHPLIDNSFQQKVNQGHPHQQIQGKENLIKSRRIRLFEEMATIQ